MKRKTKFMVVPTIAPPDAIVSNRDITTAAK